MFNSQLFIILWFDYRTIGNIFLLFYLSFGLKFEKRTKNSKVFKYLNINYIMIDNKDKLILDELENNARVSFTGLARVLNISEAAVRKRIKKLEENEVILGYKATVNYKKLGYKNKVIMGVDCESKQYFDVLSSLKKIEDVKNLSTSSGDHMIMFDVWVKDMDHLKEMLDKINKIEGVTQSCPSILQESM